MTDATTITCPRCSGAGDIAAWRPGEVQGAPSTRTCPVCDGRGRVTAHECIGDPCVICHPWIAIRDDSQTHPFMGICVCGGAIEGDRVHRHVGTVDETTCLSCRGSGWGHTQDSGSRPVCRECRGTGRTDPATWSAK